jgi:protein-tyrosine phosphatase
MAHILENTIFPIKVGNIIMESESRTIQFENVHNFRDIGGFLTEDGKLMKRGLYFRSDSLHSFSKNDISKIQGFQIKSIIDLRTPNERSKKLCVELERLAIQVINIPIYPLPDKRDPNMIQQMFDLLNGKYKRLNIETFMFDIYRRMAMEHGQEINRIFTFLSEKHNLPAIIHCTAGKDRTGWLSYLLQSVARVPVKEIYEDYLFSNNYTFDNEVIKKHQKMFAWLQFCNFDPNKFKPLQEARLEYLKAAEDSIFGKYETIEKYLVGYCMIPDRIMENIKNILLECAP